MTTPIDDINGMGNSNSHCLGDLRWHDRGGVPCAAHAEKVDIGSDAHVDNHGICASCIAGYMLVALLAVLLVIFLAPWLDTHISG